MEVVLSTSLFCYEVICRNLKDKLICVLLLLQKKIVKYDCSLLFGRKNNLSLTVTKFPELPTFIMH